MLKKSKIVNSFERGKCKEWRKVNWIEEGTHTKFFELVLRNAFRFEIRSEAGRGCDCSFSSTILFFLFHSLFPFITFRIVLSNAYNHHLNKNTRLEYWIQILKRLFWYKTFIWISKVTSIRIRIEGLFFFFLFRRENG